MLTLYNCGPSGNCYKARLLAALLHIDLSAVDVSLMKGEQRTPDYLAINPKGQVPALVDDDAKITLTDSAAILIYLAGKSSYWSAAVSEQALITNWLAFAGTTVAAGLGLARAILLFGIPGALGEAQKKGEMSLNIIEKHLAGREWLECNRPTIADVAIFVYVSEAPVGKVSLEPFENVRNWIDRVKALPGFVPMDG